MMSPPMNDLIFACSLSLESCLCVMTFPKPSLPTPLPPPGTYSFNNLIMILP